MTREEAMFCEKSYIGETNCTDCKYYGTETCQSRESHKMAIEALEQQSKWIPCSERLPEKNVWVLVTFKMANGENSVGIKRINQWNGQWEDEIDIAYSESIIAWMSLPQPYREVEV